MSASRSIPWYRKAWIRFSHWAVKADPGHLKIWTSKDGRQTRICYLDDKHLCNIIRMLHRRQAEMQSAIYANPPQGEYARMAFDEWMSEQLMFPLDFKPVHPLWQDLINEAALRGLRW